MARLVRNSHRRGRWGSTVIFLMMFVAGYVVVYATSFVERELGPMQDVTGQDATGQGVTRHDVTRPASARFVDCAGQNLYFCVVDGDTIRFEGVKIRIADIDTPEIFSPQCSAEARLGHRATARLQSLLNQGPVSLVRSGSRDEDRYGRKLRVVVRDGQSLGDILVAEGLARTWDGARHSWCT